MLLADVHAHIGLFRPDEVSGVVDRAASAGVKAIINNGIDVKSNRVCLELASRYNLVKAALGLYPVDALQLTDEEIDAELAFIKKNRSRVAGIGEIGMDFLKAGEQVRQRDIFLRQVELATSMRKPVIVHSRKAEAEVVDALVSSGARKVVMHCCMGSMKVIRKADDAGFCFSIPALIVRNSHFRKVVEVVQGTQILTETDAPFLSPREGERSEPAMVAESVKVIAEIKGITSEECANAVFSNYQRLFS